MGISVSRSKFLKKVVRRKRQMSTTLPLFWHLSSVSKKERIDASVKLVGALEQFQTQFTQQPAPGISGSDEEDEEDPKLDGLDLSNAPDVAYSIRRLIRGLASSRECSRLGFAVALTELLSRIDTVTCPQIVTLLVESTKNQGSMTGQEERDILFAQLFGFLSIIQSGLAVRTKPLSTSASSSTLSSSAESYEDVISRLVELGEKKSWLRESAWFAISLAVDALHESAADWQDDAVSKSLEILFQKNSVWSTEKLALVLKLQDYYPKRDWKVLLSPVFKNIDILSTGNLPTISRILKESTTDEDGIKDPSKAPSGMWKPQLNFAWDIILDQLLPGPNSQRPAKGSFQDFFRVVVDESLFSSTSSPQRKYWGFQVFQKSLKRVTEDTMPMLFTKNFMRTWINHLSKKDRYLHKVAQQTATEVQAFVNDKPHAGFALILQLTGPNGSQQFDKLTKTKTMESILSSLDTKGIGDYIDHLFSQADESDGKVADIAAANTRRSWIIEQLGGLIRNGKIPKEDGWVQSVLDWLVVHGLFIVKKKSSKSHILPLRTTPTPPFSDELRQSCRSRLLMCLSDLSGQAIVIKKGDKAAKLTAVASDGDFWISKVLTTIEELEGDKKHVSLAVDIDEDDRALFTRARETIVTLRNRKGDQQESARGAELLLLGTLLQHYCADDDEDSMDSEALETCIDATSRMLLSDGKKKKGKKPKDTANEENTDEPVDVLVDTVIGFLEKSTAYMRTVGNQVFSLLAESVKETTIDLIVTQLERRDPSQLEEEDEDMEDGGDSEGDVEDSTESKSDKSSEGADSDDDNDDEEADLELRNKIEEALRVNGIEPATGDTDSEEEELMDDDQMMAIDEQLAQVFRSRANEKKSGKNDAQREATHFKNRVLDLVDTYLKKQPANPFVLRFIMPLVDIVIGSSQDERQLSDKARGIIRSRFGKVKDVPTDVDIEQVTLIAANLHLQARKAHSSELLSILSLCGIYLSRILAQLKAEKPLLESYRESLVDFTTRKNSSLNSHFFQDFIKRFPVLAWDLRQNLLDQCRKSINGYRQGQVLQLLELLVSLLPSIPNHDAEAVAFMPLLRELLLDLAQESCSEKGTLTAVQMKEIFKLGLLGVRQTKRLSPQSTQQIWEPKSWRLLHQSLKTSRLKASPALQKMCEQVVRMSEEVPNGKPSTKNPNPVASKRKVEEVNGDDATATTFKKIKRKKVKGDTI